MKEFFKKIMKDSISRTISLIAVVLFVVLVIVLIVGNKSEKPDDALLIGKITKSSELTTAKIDFTGLKEYDNDGVFLINKNKFTMVYKATARVGFEVDQVEVNSNHTLKKINIKIPEPGILEVHADGNSLRFFDENFAFFKDNKVDTGKAIAAAEEAAKEELGTMGIIDMAKKQAEDIIKGLISDSVPNDYEIVVEFKKVENE